MKEALMRAGRIGLAVAALKGGELVTPAPTSADTNPPRQDNSGLVTRTPAFDFYGSVPYENCDPAIKGFGMVIGAAATGSGEGYKSLENCKTKEVLEPAFQKGIGMFWNGNYSPREEVISHSQEWVDYAKRNNVNTVSISIPFQVDGVNSGNVYRYEDKDGDEKRDGTPSAESLGIFLQMLQENNIYAGITFIANEGHLRDISGASAWKGKINPQGQNVDLFFDNYANNVILPVVQEAAKYGVGEICIGSELEDLQKHKGKWQELYAKTKTASEGAKVTYNFNNSTGRLDVELAKIFDKVGIDEYASLDFPAVPTGTPLSVDQIKAAMKPHADIVAKFAAESGKEVVITEFGVRPDVDGPRKPYEDIVNGEPDFQTQANYIKAFTETYGPVVKGLRLWGYDWHNGLDREYPGNGPFSIVNNDEAEAVIRDFYAK